MSTRHDIKGHIAVIQAFGELLQRHLADAEDKKGVGYVEKILDRARQLNEFVSQAVED